MKPWVRQQVNQLCLHASDSFGGQVDFGGIPGDEFFGATGFAGDTNLASDAGHRHKMPDLTDIFDDIAFFFDDCATNTPSQFFNINTASTVVGGRDDIGAYGGFGTVDLQTNNSNTGSSGILLQNQGAVAANVALHLWQRVIELKIRCAPGFTIAADMLQAAVAVGGMVSNLAYGNTIVQNVTDGVFFRLLTDAGGVGNWFAVAINNGTETSIDTGVTYVNDGTRVGFQEFKISYDNPNHTATFSIDDVQVAVISTNIPPSTRKLAGFGVWKQNIPTGSARQLLYGFDTIEFVGQRVAT